MNTMEIYSFAYALPLKPTCIMSCFKSSWPSQLPFRWKWHRLNRPGSCKINTCTMHKINSKRFLPIKYLFTRCYSVCHNVNFSLAQAMGFMATYGSVHMGTCVSDFCCDTDLNGEVISDIVADALCEWTLIPTFHYQCTKSAKTNLI